MYSALRAGARRAARGNSSRKYGFSKLRCSHDTMLYSAKCISAIGGQDPGYQCDGNGYVGL